MPCPSRAPPSPRGRQARPDLSDGVATGRRARSRAKPQIVYGYPGNEKGAAALGVGGDKFTFFIRNNGKEGSAWLQPLGDNAAPDRRHAASGVSAVASGISAARHQDQRHLQPVRLQRRAGQDSRRLPDVMTIRQSTSLIGLDREGVEDRAGRRPACRKNPLSMRVSQLWNWIYVHGARDFAAMTNLAKDFRALLENSFTLARPEIVTAQVSRRRHPQMAAASTGAGHRVRDRLYPGKRSRHFVRLLPGRLHPDLPLLPHRHPEAGAQSEPRRDTGPASDRQGCAGRLALHRAGPQGHQHRDDGDGRAALQFRQCEGGAGAL